MCHHLSKSACSTDEPCQLYPRHTRNCERYFAGTDEERERLQWLLRVLLLTLLDEQRSLKLLSPSAYLIHAGVDVPPPADES